MRFLNAIYLFSLWYFDEIWLYGIWGLQQKLYTLFFSYIPGIPLKCIAYKKAEDRGKNEFIERYAFSKRYMIARDKMTGEVVLCLRWIQKLLGRSKAPPRQSVWNDVARSVYIYIFMYEAVYHTKYPICYRSQYGFYVGKKNPFFCYCFVIKN